MTTKRKLFGLTELILATERLEHRKPVDLTSLLCLQPNILPSAIEGRDSESGFGWANAAPAPTLGARPKRELY
jgi:hypothetical protein